MIEFKDSIYFNECIRDQLTMMNPIIIKRVIQVNPSSAYPDDNQTVSRQNIYTVADVSEPLLSEQEGMGGGMMVGDITIWCQEFIQGPKQNFLIENSVADIIEFNQQDYVVVCVPTPGYLKDGAIPMGQRVIARKRGNLTR